MHDGMQVDLDTNTKQCSSHSIQMSADQWEAVQTFYHEQKRNLTEHITDFAGIEYDFSKLDVTDGNIAFTEIFPYCTPFIIPHGQTTYLMEDQYCMNPSCHCKEVILSFHEIAGNKALAPAYVFNYHYDKNHFESYQPDDPVDLQFLASLRIAIPNLAEMCKKRHRGLRAMYEGYQERLAAKRTVNLPVRIGRNDPCPCGSGKKYKKCCGASR
ncbi:SEC-C metal-binding domain-containing protein [Sphaerochaeta sp.]